MNDEKHYVIPYNIHNTKKALFLNLDPTEALIVSASGIIPGIITYPIFGMSIATLAIMAIPALLSYFLFCQHVPNEPTLFKKITQFRKKFNSKPKQYVYQSKLSFNLSMSDQIKLQRMIGMVEDEDNLEKPKQLKFRKSNKEEEIKEEEIKEEEIKEEEK